MNVQVVTGGKLCKNDTESNMHSFVNMGEMSEFF